MWARHLLLCFVAALSIGSGADVPGSGTGRSTGVGLFVLRGHKHRRFERVILHALSVVADEAAADELGSGAAAPPSAPLPKRVELHVLVTYQKEYAVEIERWEPYCPPQWWGGVHVCNDGVNPYSPRVRNHQGNYMHKIFHGLHLCEIHGLPFFVSLDDDVLVSPPALSFMLRSAHGAFSNATDGMGCSTLSPSLSTGIPSTDMFIDAFFTPQQRKLAHECFSSSTIPDDFIFQTGFDVLNPMPSPWDARRFFESVDQRLDPGMKPFRGVHPVRSNSSCNALVTRESRRLVHRFWDSRHEQKVVKWSPGDSGDKDGHRMPYPTPYLCNSFWMTSVHFLSQLLRERADLFLDNLDELAMNRFVVEKTLRGAGGHCFTTPAFVLHPAYNSVPAGFMRLETESFGTIMAHIHGSSLATTSPTLEGSSMAPALPRQQPRHRPPKCHAAIIVAGGEARSFLRPAVHSVLATNVVGSLAAGYSTSIFLSLTLPLPDPVRDRFDLRTVIVDVVDRNGPLPAAAVDIRCAVPGQDPASPEEYFQQTRRGFSLAQAYEIERGYDFAFDWFIRIRADAVVVAPLPSISSFDKNQITIPGAGIGLDANFAIVSKQLAPIYFSAEYDGDGAKIQEHLVGGIPVINSVLWRHLFGFNLRSAISLVDLPIAYLNASHGGRRKSDPCMHFLRPVIDLSFIADGSLDRYTAACAKIFGIHDIDKDSVTVSNDAVRLQRSLSRRKELLRQRPISAVVDKQNLVLVYELNEENQTHGNDDAARAALRFLKAVGTPYGWDLEETAAALVESSAGIIEQGQIYIPATFPGLTVDGNMLENPDHRSWVKTLSTKPSFEYLNTGHLYGNDYLVFLRLAAILKIHWSGLRKHKEYPVIMLGVDLPISASEDPSSLLGEVGDNGDNTRSDYIEALATAWLSGMGFKLSSDSVWNSKTPGGADNNTKPPPDMFQGQQEDALRVSDAAKQASDADSEADRRSRVASSILPEIDCPVSRGFGMEALTLEEIALATERAWKAYCTADPVDWHSCICAHQGILFSYSHVEQVEDGQEVEFYGHEMYQALRSDEETALVLCYNLGHALMALSGAFVKPSDANHEWTTTPGTDSQPLVKCKAQRLLRAAGRLTAFASDWAPYHSGVAFLAGRIHLFLLGGASPRDAPCTLDGGLPEDHAVWTSPSSPSSPSETKAAARAALEAANARDAADSERISISFARLTAAVLAPRTPFSAREVTAGSRFYWNKGTRFEGKTAPFVPEDVILAQGQLDEAGVISIRKVTHDRDQFRMFSKQQFPPSIPEELLPYANDLPELSGRAFWGHFADKLQRLLDASGSIMDSSKVFRLPETSGNGIEDDHMLVRAAYGRFIHTTTAPALQASSPLGSGWFEDVSFPTVSDAESTPSSPSIPRFQATDESLAAGGIGVVEQCLSPLALATIRRYITEAPNWHTNLHGGYLGAYLWLGFEPAVAFQIGGAIRRLLPKSLQRHRLQRIWAYKFDNDRPNNANGPRISLHRDPATFTVNIWLTPWPKSSRERAAADGEASGAGKTAGGLKIHPVRLKSTRRIQASKNYDMIDLILQAEEALREAYNDTENDAAFGASDNKGESCDADSNTSCFPWTRQQKLSPWTVPYSGNTCTIFHSQYLHETIPAAFPGGFGNERVCVTLLYGDVHFARSPHH